MRIKLGIVAAAAGTIAAATATAALASPGPSVHSAPAPTTPTATATLPTTTASPTLPGYAKPVSKRTITLTVADNGKTIHVARGKQVVVKLVVKVKHNPDATTWWHPVTESGEALEALSPALIAHPGVTDARYRAIAKGEATLSSSRAVCPQHSDKPACHSMQGWQVTVDVR